jgi:hypothetical protein
VLFQKLAALAKRVDVHKQQDFCTVIQTIRASMTRIKMASEKDMGTNFTDLASPGSLRPKFKYGISLFSKKENENKQMVSVFVGEDEIARRKELAMNFRQILTDDKVNEIVVAYRSHANLEFPLFTKWDATAKVYKSFKLGERSLDNYIVSDAGVLSPA